MKKTLWAGAVALAVTGLFVTMPAAQAYDRVAGIERAATAIDIGRIRIVLQLTPEQARHWPPVEAALRDIARRQAPGGEGGLVQRVKRRVVSLVLDSAAIRRLAAAARPLIASLDTSQLIAASGLADEMGLGPVVAALR